MDPDADEVTAEISLLLVGGAAADTERVKQGLALVFRHWARPVFTILRGLHPPSDLSTADFPDLWQETVQGLTVRVRNGYLREEGSLFSLVCTIARRLAVRHVERRPARATVPLIDDLVSGGGRRPWADLDPLERAEVFQLIREAIPALPPKAGTVIRVFIERFPESLSMERLREQVSEETGREETIGGVKRGLQEAREGLRERLRRKGYDFRTGGYR